MGLNSVTAAALGQAVSQHSELQDLSNRGMVWG